MNLEHRIIEEWPGELREGHKISPFSRETSYGDTLELLDRELRMLSAQDVILETAHRQEDLSLSGTIRGNAREPEHPGVIISFESRFGALRYYTDMFWGWRNNLRAIALGLEALRKVERYGIATRGEQYQGYKRLPPGFRAATDGQLVMTDTRAREVIAAAAGMHKSALVTAEMETIAAIYRMAAKRTHPDTAPEATVEEKTRMRETWAELNAAAAVLGVSK